MFNQEVPYATISTRVHTVGFQIGRTALHVAAEHGSVKVAKFLVHDDRFSSIDTKDSVSRHCSFSMNLR